MSDSVPIQPEPASPSRVRVPADYYGSSPAEVRPIFPRWVSTGCGVTAAVLLVVAFVGGAFIAHTGVGKLMDLLLGSMQGEMAPMFAKNVSPAQRAALESEFDRLRANVRSERISIAKLDPVISAVRDASADHEITPEEAAKMTAAMKALNDAPVKKPVEAEPLPARH